MVEPSIHIEPGRINGRAGVVRVDGSVNASVVACQQKWMTRNERQRMLSTCTTACCRYSAGRSFHDGFRRPRTRLRSVEKDTVRIIRVHGDALVVPILGIIAGTVAAVSEGGARRTGNLRPGSAAIRRSIGAELAAGSIVAAGI